MANTQKLVHTTWGARCNFHPLVAFLIMLLVVAMEEKTTVKKSLSDCNLFDGKWVFDNKSYPLYKEQQCSFMWDEFACETYGRKDSGYQNWRWQPLQCDLPRFNATAMLERLRGKRLVFIGDSLNRDQFVSLICLLVSSIPPGLKSQQLVWNRPLVTFKATEYNATIDYYWSPLLVESNCDDPEHHPLSDLIVRAQAIEKHARHWTDDDILVFDSYAWWLRPKIKVLWGSFQSSDGIYKEIDMVRSYEMALKTWSDWLEIHINRTRTQLFFVSMSPHHRRAEDWGMDTNQNCYNETEPIFKDGYKGSESRYEMMRMVEAAIDELKTRGLKVQILNITQLSEYRKDGHPTIYRKYWVNLTEEQLSNQRSYADCGHWCLPSVPDTWNELLYAYIFYY